MIDSKGDRFALTDKAELEYWFYLARNRAECLRLDKGEPDFLPHPDIIQAALKLIQSGRVKYSSGLPELKKAIAARLNERIGVEYCPSTEICITHGAIGGLFASFSVLGKGGGCIGIPDVSWPTFRLLIMTGGGVPIEYHWINDSSCRLGIVAGEDVRAIVVNSPHNPTGRVSSPGELENLAANALTGNTWVVSDETYEAMVFARGRHISIASLPGMRERTLVVGSFSKTYCMTGWRIGYVAGPAEMIRRVAEVSHMGTGGVSQIAQEAAIAALTVPQPYIDKIVDAYERRAELAARVLAENASLSVVPPGGTFYLFVRLGKYTRSSREFARRLLDDYGVATIPGAVFGSAGEGHLRLSLTVDDAQIEQAAQRIVECVKAFQDAGVAIPI